MALQDENDRMRDELNRNFLEGTEDKEDEGELIMINNGL
jgi:hypothetical protein